MELTPEEIGNIRLRAFYAGRKTAAWKDVDKSTWLYPSYAHYEKDLADKEYFSSFKVKDSSQEVLFSLTIEEMQKMKAFIQTLK